MAHVLVAQCELPMTKMLTEILDLEGYKVAQVNAGEQIHEALLAAPQPFVVLYYTTLLFRLWDPLADDDGQQDSEDEAHRPQHPWQAMLQQKDAFRRHRYIETRAWAFPPPADMQPFYDQFGVTVLMMPLDIELVVSVVAAAARQLV